MKRRFPLLVLTFLAINFFQVNKLEAQFFGWPSFSKKYAADTKFEFTLTETDPAASSNLYLSADPINFQLPGALGFGVSGSFFPSDRIQLSFNATRSYSYGTEFSARADGFYIFEGIRFPHYYQAEGIGAFYFTRAQKKKKVKIRVKSTTGYPVFVANAHTGGMWSNSIRFLYVKTEAPVDRLFGLRGGIFSYNPNYISIVEQERTFDSEVNRVVQYTTSYSLVAGLAFTSIINTHVNVAKHGKRAKERTGTFYADILYQFNHNASYYQSGIDPDALSKPFGKVDDVIYTKINQKVDGEIVWDNIGFRVGYEKHERFNSYLTYHFAVELGVRPQPKQKQNIDPTFYDGVHDKIIKAPYFTVKYGIGLARKI